jgi:metal-responsive CopG/Arc/MetJ family transcriptional regulator
MKRGAVRTVDSEFLATWIPKELVREIDQAVRDLDIDRSKFLRAACREKLRAINTTAS